MKKVYCKDCRHNMTFPGMFMGRIVWDYCMPGAGLGFSDNLNPTRGVARMLGQNFYWMDELNEHNNCPYYKRKWWKVWVR